LCFGAATKFSQASLDADKRYLATLRLGRRSSTGDLEGELSAEVPIDLDRAAIDAAIARHTGSFDQLPPMHSAVKKDGKALYEYARAGLEVERTPRRVTIHRIQLVEWQGATLVLDVHCSKGTYIRTLADELGATLRCGAHLAALRRTASGPLRVGNAIRLERLAELDEGDREALLLPPDVLLADWPRIDLDAAEAARFLCGLRRRVELADQPAVRVYGPGRADFLGTAHLRGGELIAERLLSPAEVRAMPAPLAEAACIPERQP